MTSAKQRVHFILRNVSFPQHSRVEIILAPARTVWDDFFDVVDINDDDIICQELCEVESGIFTGHVSLKVNTYHFLFRIENTKQTRLTSSCDYFATYLANGRKLNYINVGRIDEIRSQQNITEGQTSDDRENEMTDVAEPKQPQPSGGRKKRRRIAFCCYLD